MPAGASWGEPVDLARDVDLAAGDYEAWGLSRVFPERFHATRADVILAVGGHDVGTLDDAATERALAFWEPLVRYAWSPIGRFHAAATNDVRLSIRWRD